MTTIRRPPGCTCLYEADQLVRRCDQCEDELRALLPPKKDKAA